MRKNIAADFSKMRHINLRRARRELYSECLRPRSGKRGRNHARSGDAFNIQFFCQPGRIASALRPVRAREYFQ
jgi:hypothetical protein